MQVHWVIEEVNFQNDNHNVHRLTYMLAERGNQVVNFRYIPFGGTDYSFLTDLLDKPVVFQGCLNSLLDMKDRKVALPKPFAWYEADLFNCSTYYWHLRDLVLQQERWEGEFGQLPRLLDSIYQKLGDKDKVFFRPDDNEKTFNGELVHKSLFKGWYRYKSDYNQINPKAIVHACKPVPIETEWRFLIVDGKIVAGSQYKKSSCVEINKTYDPLAKDFAEKVAATWSPFSVFVIDVGLVGKDEYRVVEIGPFNYAGLYNMDLNAVIDAVESVALREWAA